MNRLLDSPDDFVQLTASVLITTFLSVDPATASMQGNARESEQGKKMLATVSSLIVHLSTLIRTLPSVTTIDHVGFHLRPVFPPA